MDFGSVEGLSFRSGPPRITHNSAADLENFSSSDGNSRL